MSDATKAQYRRAVIRGAKKAGQSEAETRALFRNTYFVSPERTELALDAARAGALRQS